MDYQGIQYDKPVVFLVGRMNPPTPGHMKLIQTLYQISLKMNAIPRVYLSLSHNEKKMSKTQKNKKIIGLSETKEDGSPINPWVKHKSYENPLNPVYKQQVVIEMLKNIGIHGENIVIADNDCNGIYKALECVKSLQDSNDLKFFVMGAELDPKERQNREKMCRNQSVEEPRPISINFEDQVNCIFLERTQDESDPIASISGSKIRLYAANLNLDLIHSIYDGYLTPEQINELIINIRMGLNMENPEMLGLFGKKGKSSKKLKSKKKKNKRKNKTKKRNKGD